MKLNVPIQLNGGNEADCPTVMLIREVYVCLDSGKIFAGTGTGRVQVGGSSGGGVWGSITGNLTDQTDLETVLTALAYAISTEASTRSSADSTLTSNLASEVSRAEAAESTEASTRASADSTLASNLASEVSRAEAAESTNASAISTEASTRASADSTLASNLASEVSRAEAAEGLLVPQTTTVNGHALSGNVVVSASDLTTGTLPHAQLPALVAGDIPDISATYEVKANKDANSGYAGLDSGGLLKSAELPTDAAGTIAVSEIDAITIKINAANKDIILTRSAAASLAVTGSPNFKGGVVTNRLANVAAPTVVPTLGSASQWSYAVVALDGAGNQTAAQSTTISTGAATLDGTHFNTITWTGVAGAVTYNVIRTKSATSPTTVGIIGSVAADATLSFVDNGVAAGGENWSQANTTGTIGNLVPDGSGLLNGPFFWGGYGPVMPIVSGANSSLGNTNRAQAALFYVPFAMKLNKITISVSAVSASASQAASFGIADINANIITSVQINVSTGQATGARQGNLSGVTIQPGFYYFCWTTNSTDATFAVTVAVATAGTILNKTGSGSSTGRVGIGATTSAGAFPNKHLGVTSGGSTETTITPTSLTLPYCLFE